ncbi:MAG: hypothetical protein ABS69_19255 [Nitrosomonadales bacterium SCN 54-20]|nr:MAG: hypothetical protein ABS69_19255 [Nitrosomonadales bacterium SCN 54-20]
MFLLQSLEKKIETNRFVFPAISVRHRKFTPAGLRLMRKSEGGKRLAKWTITDAASTRARI